MASKQDPTPIAPARTLAAGSSGDQMVKGPQIPAQPARSAGEDRGGFAARFRRTDAGAEHSSDDRESAPMNAGAAEPRQVRQAKLRLVQIEPWSVMKASFVLSVAIAIVTVVAVAIVWGVLGAAGLWDSVNSIVQDSIGDSSGAPFEIQKYLGTSRILGFTMLVAVADIVLITAIATLAAFLYNLAATLVGGIEVTFAEDK